MSVDDAIGIAAAHISKGEFALADFICRDVLAAYPGHAIALNLIGVIAAQLGLLDRAIAHFEMALAGTPPFLPAKDNLETIKNAQARAPRPRASTTQQFLLIKAWGFGFWSDVSHVLGCLLLAEITGRIPVTHWGRNSLFRDASGQDAFRLYFEPLSACTLDTILTRGTTSFFPTKWSIANLHEEDIAKWQGAGAKMGGLHFINRPETVAVSDFYIGVVDLLPWIPPTHKLHGKSLEEVYHYLVTTHLKPRGFISAQVEELDRRYIHGKPTIAVHVRGSDKRIELTNLDQVNKLYFDAIDREDSSWQILLLTDDTRCIEVFQERYGNRIAVTDSIRTDNDRHSLRPVRGPGSPRHRSHAGYLFGASLYKIHRQRPIQRLGDGSVAQAMGSWRLCASRAVAIAQELPPQTRVVMLRSGVFERSEVGTDRGDPGTRSCSPERHPL